MNLKVMTGTLALALALSLGGCKKKEEAKPKEAPKATEVKKEEPKVEPKPEPKVEAPKEEPKVEEPKVEAPKPADNMTVLAGLQAALGESKMDEAVKALAENLEVTVPGAAEPFKGADGFKKMLETMGAGLGEVKMKPAKIFDAGNTIVVLGVMNAKHTGDFMGTPATNKDVGTTYADVITFENGKISKWFHVCDRMTLKNQIAPAEGATAPAVPVLPETAETIKADAVVAADVDAVKAFLGKAVLDLVPGFEAIAAPDVKDFDYAVGAPVDGLEPLKTKLTLLTTAFPDLKITADEVIGANGYVIARYTWTGTQKADLGAIKASEKAVTIPAVAIYKFEGGKVKELHTISNSQVLLEQLGVLPVAAPAPAADPAAAPAAPAPAADPAAAPAPAAPAPAPAAP